MGMSVMSRRLYGGAIAAVRHGLESGRLPDRTDPVWPDLAKTLCSLADLTDDALREAYCKEVLSAKAHREYAMRMQIAAVRSGGEFMMDELILTPSQLEAYQRASRELSLVSGKELADIYFKGCVK